MFSVPGDGATPRGIRRLHAPPAPDGTTPDSLRQPDTKPPAALPYQLWALGAPERLCGRPLLLDNRRRIARVRHDSCSACRFLAVCGDGSGGWAQRESRQETRRMERGEDETVVKRDRHASIALHTDQVRHTDWFQRTDVWRGGGAGPGRAGGASLCARSWQHVLCCWLVGRFRHWTNRRSSATRRSARSCRSSRRRKPRISRRSCRSRRLKRKRASEPRRLTIW